MSIKCYQNILSIADPDVENITNPVIKEPVITVKSILIGVDEKFKTGVINAVEKGYVAGVGMCISLVTCVIAFVARVYVSLQTSKAKQSARRQRRRLARERRERRERRARAGRGRQQDQGSD